MPRLSTLTLDQLTTEQRAVHDAIQGGPRGKMGLAGPFGVWVRAPNIGNAVQACGAAVRFGTDLPEPLKEIAICCVGAHFHAKFEFAAHANLARQAGVAQDIIDAIGQEVVPAFTDDSDALVYQLAQALLQRHRLTDDEYAAGVAALGETGMIELVTVIGYYCMVSFTLNTFEIPLSDTMTDPFPTYPG